MFRRTVYCVTALLLGACLPGYGAQSNVWSKKKIKQTKQRTEQPKSAAATTAGSEQNRNEVLTKETEVRRAQEAAIKARQAQARHAEETQKLLLEQLHQSQEVAKTELAKSREADEQERLKIEADRKAHQREVLEMQQTSATGEPGQTENMTLTKDQSQQPHIDEAEQAFKKDHAQTNAKLFAGSRKVTDRNSLPAISVRPLPAQKASVQPFLIKNIGGEQRHQGQIIQQNLQARLLAIPASDMPQSYGEQKTLQVSNYFNNYPAYLNHQSISINRKNTYIRDVPPTQYPAWYERTSGWTYCSGFVLGSDLQVGPDWFGFDWPAMFGPTPTGFLCQQDYFPTPWIYIPFNDHWRQAGDQSYKEGPEPSYTGPISVEIIEPVTAKIPDKFGVPVFQTINVIYLYNAFYDPEFERWGYLNREGYFVWLNI